MSSDQQPYDSNDDLSDDTDSTISQAKSPSAPSLLHPRLPEYSMYRPPYNGVSYPRPPMGMTYNGGQSQLPVGMMYRPAHQSVHPMANAQGVSGMGTMYKAPSLSTHLIPMPIAHTFNNNHLHEQSPIPRPLTSTINTDNTYQEILTENDQNSNISGSGGSDSTVGDISDFEEVEEISSSSRRTNDYRGRGRGRGNNIGRGSRAGIMGDRMNTNYNTSGHTTISDIGNSEENNTDIVTNNSTSNMRLSPPRRSWLVPYDHITIPFGHFEDRSLEKILAHKPDPDKPGSDLFLIKWKNMSYLHRVWIPQSEVEQHQNGSQRIQRYLNKIHDNVSSWGSEGFNPAYLRIDRIIDEGEVNDTTTDEAHVYYLVKWENQPYDCSTWETKETCEELDSELVEEYLQRRDIPDHKRDARAPRRPPSTEWQKFTLSPIYKNGNQLRQYQLDGVNWLVYCWLTHQSSIMADEMGLGKTVQSVAFLHELWKRFDVRGPFLVVAPLSTVPHWEREFRAWADMNVIVYHGNATARNLIVDTEYYWKDQSGQHYPERFKFDVLITTYEMAMAGERQLRPISWRACVMDEAHKLKNKASKISELLKCFHMEHKVLLTGTPLQNSLDELWALLNFLDPIMFRSEESFMSQYGHLKTSADVEQLQLLLKPLMLRRLKEDVEKSIPIKEETVVEVELTNIQKKWYRAILERNFSMLKKGSKGRDAMPNLINIVMELRKCCIHPYLLHGAEDIITQETGANTPEKQYRCMIQASGKLVLLDKLLKKLRDGGHKVLIFSQMTKCLDILGDYLRGQRYLFERIDGNVRGTERQAAIDRFSLPDSESFVFLLCTRAGGVGINLTAADTAVIFDSDWNPQNDLQAQARCHRIGQTKPVQVYRLVTRNSYEKEMFDRAGFKLGLDRAVLQKMSADAAWTDEPEKRLSKKEVEELLKKGAYGAFMDDNESNAFCEEDIDQILKRRTMVIKHDNTVNAGSIFSKATFASEGSGNDIDINDPNFWDKVAEKASFDIQEPADPNSELIINEPRHRRAMQRAYDRGSDMNEEGLEFMDDAFSEGINRWSSTEKLMFERRLMVFGMFNWEKMHVAFPRRSIKDLQAVTRDLIRHLVRKCVNPLEDPLLVADAEAAVNEYCEPGLLPPNESYLPYEGATPRQVIEYKSFLISAPREYVEGVEKKGKYMLARVQLLKQVHDILPSDLRLAKYLEVPPTTRPPADWWGVEEDRDLLISIAKHGYHVFGPMRRDKELIFSRRHYDPITLRDSLRARSRRGKKKQSQQQTAEDEEDDLEGLDDDHDDTPIDESHYIDNHIYAWPSKSEIGARLRKVVLASLKEIKRRGSILAVPSGDQMGGRASGGPRQDSWVKRERIDFMRTLIGFGVDMANSGDGNADWNQFRTIASLMHKSDLAMDEYHEHVIAVCKHVIDVDNARANGVEVNTKVPEKWEGDEEYTVEKARKTLKRNDFMWYLRQRVLAHADFDTLIMNARKTSNIPDWWTLGVHDKALLQALSKHGFGRSEALIGDSEFPFCAIAEQMRYNPQSVHEYESDPTKKKMFSIVLGLPWPKDSAVQKRAEGICLLVDPHPPISEFYSQPVATTKVEMTTRTDSVVCGGTPTSTSAVYNYAQGLDSGTTPPGGNGKVIPVTGSGEFPTSESGAKITIETWRKSGKRKRIVINIARDIYGNDATEETETAIQAVATFLTDIVEQKSVSTSSLPPPISTSTSGISTRNHPHRQISSQSISLREQLQPPLAKFTQHSNGSGGNNNTSITSSTILSTSMISTSNNTTIPSHTITSISHGQPDRSSLSSVNIPSSPTSTIGEDEQDVIMSSESGIDVHSRTTSNTNNVHSPIRCAPAISTRPIYHHPHQPHPQYPPHGTIATQGSLLKRKQSTDDQAIASMSSKPEMGAFTTVDKNGEGRMDKRLRGEVNNGSEDSIRSTQSSQSTTSAIQQRSALSSATSNTPSGMPPLRIKFKPFAASSAPPTTARTPL